MRSSVARRILDGLVWLVLSSARRPLPWLLGWLALTGAALWAASTLLTFDPRFDALLPEHSRAVTARREAGRRIGPTDLYLVAIESTDPQANLRFAADVAAAIAKWPGTEWVLTHRELGVLRDRALLFASKEDLAEGAALLDRVVSRALHRGRAAASGFIEVDEDAEAADRARDAKDRARLKELAGRLRRKDASETHRALVARYPALRDALASDDGRVMVVLARMARSTNDVAFSRQVYQKGEALLRELGPARYHPKLKASVGGAYRSFQEYDQALRDIAVASAASLGMVLLLLVIFFRRVRAVVVILVPLCVGIVWSSGVTALVVGKMNLITSFIVAILTGLGIDFAIHLYAAYRAARGAGRTLEEGLEQAVRETASGMLTAALTTMAALLTLTLAEFRAFREFGGIAALGVGICLVAAFLVLPPVVALLERIRPERIPPVTEGGREVSPRRIRLVALGAGLAGLAITAALAPFAPRIAFEYDFGRLRGRELAQPGIAYGQAMRGSRGSSPMALLGRDEAALRAAHAELTRRQEAEQACCDAYLAGRRPEGRACERMGLHDPAILARLYQSREGRICRPRIVDVMTIATFVPEGQEAKLAEIRKIRDTLQPDPKKGDPAEEVAKDLREDVRELRRLAERAAPIRFEDLPLWARRALTERAAPGGPTPPPHGAIGFFYTGLKFQDIRDMMRLAEDYGRLRVAGSEVHVAASLFVVAELVETVLRDGPRMALYAGAGVLLLLLLDLRRVLGALLCFGALVLGFAWALGIMALLGWRLGVYNMLVLPTALGIGIDSAVHLYHRYLRLGPEYPRSPLGYTGLAVLASSLTTLAGFAGLFFISHGGLQSIAQFAVVAIGAMLGSVLLLMPALLALRASRPSAP